MPARQRITVDHLDTIDRIAARYQEVHRNSDPTLVADIAQAQAERLAWDNLSATAVAILRTGLDSRRVRDLKADRRLIRWNNTPE